MNSTDDYSGILGGGNNGGGFSYGIGVSVGILLLITAISLASYFCARNEQHQRPNSAAAAASEPPDQPPEAECAVDIGIDEATLLSYPKLLYSSKENRPKKDSTASCCSICLADYKSDDLLRLLPDCGHAFHLRCVDPWLRLHATCPVCRTSPTVTPLSTPLVEVSPLAARR